MTAICASELYSNQTICEVIEQLDQVKDDISDTYSNVLEQLEILRQAGESEIAGIGNIDYLADTSGIPVDYTAPTAASEPDYSGNQPPIPSLPATPTIEDLSPVDDHPAIPAGYVVPDADSQLISDSIFDDIYNREAERLARIGTKAERDAFYQASARGIGMPSPSLSLALSRAQQETDMQTAQVAQDKTIQEGEWLREDVKTLHELQIRNWPLRVQAEQGAWQAKESLDIQSYAAEQSNKVAVYQAAVSGLVENFNSQTAWAIGRVEAETGRYQARIQQQTANIASEAEKRGWSQLQIQTALEEADKETGYALQKAVAILSSAREVEGVILQVMGTLLSSQYTATSYSLHGGGSQSVSESISS